MSISSHTTSLSSHFKIFVGAVVALCGSVGMPSLGYSEDLSSKRCVDAAERISSGIKLNDASSQEEAHYRAAIEQCPKLADAHHNLGVVLTRRGKWEAALACFDKALEVRRSEETLIAKASVLSSLGRLDDAEAGYRQVLDDDQNSVRALQGLSVVYLSKGMISKGIELLESALERLPDEPTLLYNLAVLYERDGKTETALLTYRRAIESTPSNFPALLRLGVLEGKRGEVAEAERILQKASTVMPSSAKPHQALGAVLWAHGDLDKAEISLRRAISLEPNDVESLVSLGEVLISKSQEGVAEDLLRRAIASDPRHPEARSVLGTALIGLGRYKEAESTLKSAIELDSGNRSARMGLVLLYRRMGREDDAKRESAAMSSPVPSGTLVPLKE